MTAPFAAPWMPTQQWLPATAPLSCCVNCRSPECLSRVVSQFHVETAIRYARAGQLTYCNIFVSDVTRAMACEIPHVWHNKEMTANMMDQWLHISGLAAGWDKVSLEHATARAVLGFPSVAIATNHTGPGHVAMIVGESYGVTMITQAGASNFERGQLKRGFGGAVVSCFTHG